jgi:hypothetical protein
MGRKTMGDLVRHIFSAEKRYVERLSDRPLTDTVSIPNDNLKALFGFGQSSRKALKNFVKAFPAKQWDVPNDYKILNYSVRAAPRKIINYYPRPDSRNPPLGADCYFVPIKRFGGRTPRFPVQPGHGQRV